MMLRIDHVIIAVEDLDAAGERFRDEYGLGSVSGGEHPAFGTGNRIVPLGDDYIELMSVVDPATAAANPLGRLVQARIDAGGGPLGWVLRTDDIDAVAERLGLYVVPGARTRPDGSTLTWRLAGLEVTLEDPSIPFYIAWDDSAEHPGRMPVEHDGRGIAWVEVAADETRLKGWLGDEDVPVRVTDGPAGLRAIGIATGRGEIVLR